MPRQLYYAKIPNSRDFPLEPCIAFEKYDGTNVHFCWHSDFGWHAFGTRRDEFNLDSAGELSFAMQHENLRELPDVFRNSLMMPFEKVFQEDRRCSAEHYTVFAEFLGSNSFAGLHKPEDAKRLIAFDVVCDNELMGPNEFVEIFGHLNIARVVYRGRFTGAFADDVRSGKFGVAEGVVCKTGSRGNVQMAKIKTSAYLKKLQTAFGERWEEYWE